MPGVGTIPSSRIRRRGPFVLLLAFGLCGPFGPASRAEAAPAGMVEEPLAPRSGPRGKTLFVELPPDETGVRTENNYADPEMWGRRYRELEIGAVATGVTIGDYDGDGRPDLFVVSKTETCRLFRNLGGFKFEDVTAKAGVGDVGANALIWKQGATFVDINNDGRLDLYVCRFDAPNLLYINQGDGTFKEMAHAYGLDVKDASMMAAFGDYDRDGRLDVFIQTNLLDAATHPDGQRDYLFHQNADGTFTNVTDRSGVAPGPTHGNSAIWWDYDDDGWPDLYVANDFAVPDALYHNNRDGTFTDVIGAVAPHVPYSSMGSDLGDIDNDGHVDFMVADMSGSTREADQRTMAETRARLRDPTDGSTAVPQYPDNAILLNTGAGRFLEAAHLAGLAATDWTWSLRWEDLDNDGRLDLQVTNGMYREIHNVDLIGRRMRAESDAGRVRLVRASPVYAEKDFAFRNLGGLRFEDVSAAWGLDQKDVGFGAAFGDLDGDGDLDLLHGNYQAGATLLRNDSDSGHRVIIALRGTRSNRFGLGAKVRLESAAGTQVRELTLARGLMSSSEPIVHFGLGEDAAIRRLTVTWPSGQVQAFENLPVDRRFIITEPAAAEPTAVTGPKAEPPQFTESGAAAGLAWTAHEEAFDELLDQRLLPFRFNRRGPALAAGDLDGSGHDSLVVGGTTKDPRRILASREPGKFFAIESPSLAALPDVDDGPLLLFDADGDGNLDLLVAGGGASLPADDPGYQPRLFLNGGGGHFVPAPAGALPVLPISAGAAAAADFDRDGRIDLFIGGRVVPGKYPLTPRSALLANRGGKFEDVTDQLAPGLREVGMVTAAIWSDVDGDGWPDLVVTLEWGLVKYFHNDGGKGFTDRTEAAGFAAAGTGWWRSIATADFNGDGRPDYAVGNLGLNTPYRADPDHPALLFAGDFAGRGNIDLIEAGWDDGRLYPLRSRTDLAAVVPTLLRRFPTNDAYARATLEEVVGADKLAAATRLAATELRSGVFLSQPDGRYRFEPLPRIAQIAPLNGMAAGDFDGDGRADLYVVQNTYAPTPAAGRFDGGVSQLLCGDGHGDFKAVPPAESGLVVPGDAKAVVVVDLDGDGWPDLVVSRSNAPTLAFRNGGGSGRHSLRVVLRGPPGNPAAVGARVTAELADGSIESSEVSAGSSQLSQSGAGCFVGWTDENPARRINVSWPSGATSTMPLPVPTPATLAITPP
ncbi:MAG TPA: FG-GAP-like repeat-containing protein [Lacunisphaera sp.]|nr:FG-GAP-like repeat-containing protein [Lacunisphaera sp.]